SGCAATKDRHMLPGRSAYLQPARDSSFMISVAKTSVIAGHKSIAFTNARPSLWPHGAQHRAMLNVAGGFREKCMRAWIIGLGLIGLAACVSMKGAQTSEPPFADPNTSTAQIQAPANYPIAANLPAGDYKLDPRHASVQFRIRHENQLAWFTAR